MSFLDDPASVNGIAARLAELREKARRARLRRDVERWRAVRAKLVGLMARALRKCAEEAGEATEADLRRLGFSDAEITAFGDEARHAAAIETHKRATP